MPTNRRYDGDGPTDDEHDPASDNDRVDDLVSDADDAVTVEKSDDGVTLDGFDISKSDRDTDTPSLEDAYRGITDSVYPTPARSGGSGTGRSESVGVGRSRTGRRDAVSKADDDTDDEIDIPELDTIDGPGDGLSDEEFADAVGEAADAATDDDARDALEAVREYVDEHGRPATVSDVMAWVIVNHPDADAVA